MEVRISNENKKRIDLFIREFIDRLKKPMNVKKYNKSENLIYISELLNSEYEDNQLINEANLYIEELVNMLKNHNYNIAGMFSDVGMFAFAVNTIYRKSGDLSKLTESLNNILLQYGNHIISKSKNNKLKMSMYDCISGVSGILYYLLTAKICINNRDIIYNMIDYLIFLTKNHIYKGNDIINFHIENESLYREDEKKIFKDGVINFGLAHGMSGVLTALSKAYELQVYKDKNKLLSSIYIILDIYEKYVYYIDNIPMYPTQMDYNKYLNIDIGNIKNVPSWCYGNLSNELILSKVYRVLGDSVDYNRHKNNLINIINQNDENYYLSVPVLCHGYASVIAEQVSMYRNTGEYNFIKHIDRNINKMLDLHDDVNNKFPNIQIEHLEPNLETMVVQGHKDDLSMLCGSGGIFLSLLSVVSDKTYYHNLLMID